MKHVVKKIEIHSTKNGNKNFTFEVPFLKSTFLKIAVKLRPSFLFSGFYQHLLAGGLITAFEVPGNKQKCC